MPTIQRELDIAEEYILTRLLGNINAPVFGNTLRLFFVAKNINPNNFINQYIGIFEAFARDFMLENGYIDGQKLTRFLSVKYPSLNGLNLPNFRPIELAVALDKLLDITKIGSFIQKI
jgi:hypothetical protein